MENSYPEVIYGRFSRCVAFYTGKNNIIYINEIAKKYSMCHDYIIQHETSHYRNKSHKFEIITLLFDIALDWYSIFQIYLSGNFQLLKEHIACYKEFSTLNFSKDERLFDKTLVASFTLKQLFYQKSYDLLKPAMNGFYIIIFTPILYIFNQLTLFNYIFYYIPYLLLNLFIDYLRKNRIQIRR
jgi:hypothetical protein